MKEAASGIASLKGKGAELIERPGNFWMAAWVVTLEEGRLVKGAEGNRAMEDVEGSKNQEFALDLGAVSLVGEPAWCGG